MGKTTRKTKEEFLENAKLKHGDKYDYSLVEYINNRTKVKIICQHHGIFEQVPESHTSGYGCSSCSGCHKKTTEEFIKDVIKIHGDKYNYSESIYINNNIKIKIICPKHGHFFQTPKNHLINKQGCSGCYGNVTSTKEEFSKKSNKIHNNKYNYSLVDYINNHIKVKIICPKHGTFEQKPNNHLQGQECHECAKNTVIEKNKKLNLDIFVERSIKVHKSKYDYSLVPIDIDFKSKVKIICSKHGIFEQMPHNHMGGNTCPRCKHSKGVDKICNFLQSMDIKFEMEKTIDGCVSNKNNLLYFDLYLPYLNIYIEYDGEQHFRIVEIFGGEKSFKEQKERDQIKDAFCEENNIKLFRISYMDNIELKLNEILRLSQSFGV